MVINILRQLGNLFLQCRENIAYIDIWLYWLYITISVVRVTGDSVCCLALVIKNVAVLLAAELANSLVT